MTALAKILGLCLVTAAIAPLVKKSDLPLALSAAAVGLWLLLGMAEELRDFVRELAELTELPPAVFLPLVKVSAVAVLSRVTAAVCADAGQSALARLSETAGAVCALICAVPLLRGLIDLLNGWI